jgi:hypothetical protein
VTDTLRERCKKLLSKIQMDAILRQGNSIDDLVAFVQSEQGRSADARLENTLSVILYFPDEKEREGFIAAIHEAKPNIISRKLP